MKSALILALLLWLPVPAQAGTSPVAMNMAHLFPRRTSHSAYAVRTFAARGPWRSQYRTMPFIKRGTTSRPSSPFSEHFTRR